MQPTKAECEWFWWTNTTNDMSTKTTITPALNSRLNELVASLNAIEVEQWKVWGYTHEPDKVRWHDRNKFAAIDIGTSGAWLVEKATGEIYNIKGYGVPDRNKKIKADIGNVYTVDPAAMWRKRYNYLR